MLDLESSNSPSTSGSSSSQEESTAVTTITIHPLPSLMSLNVPPPPPVRRTDVPAVIPGSGSPSQQLHILVISQPPGSTSNSSGLSRSGNSIQAVHLFPGMTRGCQFQQDQIGKKDSSAHTSTCRNVGWRLDEVVGMSATRGPIVYWLIGHRRLMSPIRFEGRESVKRSLSVFSSSFLVGCPLFPFSPSPSN